MRSDSWRSWRGYASPVEDPLPDATFIDLRSTGGPSEEAQIRFEKASRKLQGWRVGIKIGVGTSLAVLATNVTFLIWAKRNAISSFEGVLTINIGDDCRNTDRLLHLIINVLSTLLLGASSFAMQCLGAPTREEVDKAHTQGTWLDIGTLSVRNLSRIDRKRSVLWLCLWLSSFPLHLVYNSVIFKAQSAFPNYTSFVGEDFTKGAQWSISTGVDTTSYGYRGPVITNSPSINAASENLRYLQANIAKLEQRDVSSCVYAFRSPYVPNYINYLFVSKVGYTNFNGSKSALYDITRNLPGSPGFPKSSGDKWGTDYSSSGDTNVFREMDEWFFNTDYSSFKHSKLPSIKVDYCLAEQTTARCSIRVYQPLIIVVIAFNAVKVAALIATMVMSRTFSPLVTVGDAVSSFLGRSDPITAELGPISFDEIRKRIHNARRFTSDNCPIHGNQPGSKWMVRSRHWVRTVEDPRMSMFIIVSFMIWIIVMHTFSYQNGNAVWSLSSMSSAAFGTYIVPGSDAFNLSALAVMVNSPQLAVSALYFTYNSLLTSMSAAAEFSSFSSKPRGLRVSLPSGYQRSTYWLQLPYKYGLPLLAIMAVLHWIISQAFFMLQVNVYNMENTPFAGKPRGTFTSTVNICGYSRDGVLIYFIIHGALVAGLITLCCRKFKANVPILAGCSLAISAACHLGTEEDVATTPFMPLMYGVIQTNGFVQNRVAFSGKQVGTMENEVVYQ